MNNNDKINAILSLKNWAVERQLYELASMLEQLKNYF